MRGLSKSLGFVLTAAVLLVTAACRNSGQNQSGEEATVTAGNPVTDTVRISGMKFIPQEITVNKGDTVFWINEDVVAHNVTEETNSAWASDTLNTSDTFKKVFDSSADYYCSLHVVMKGKVIIR